MRKSLARLVALLSLAVVLGGGLAALPVDAPPAQALKMFCTSTIDVKCQPQNAPILIELGIIKAPTLTTTSSGSIAAANVVAGSAATVGVVGITMTTQCGSVDTCRTKAALRTKGWEGVSYQPDPAWTPPGQSNDGLCTKIYYYQLATAGFPAKAINCDTLATPVGGRFQVKVTRTGNAYAISTTILARGSTARSDNLIGIAGACITSGGVVNNPTIIRNHFNLFDSGTVGQVLTDSHTFTGSCSGGYMIFITQNGVTTSAMGAPIFGPSGGWTAAPTGQVTVQTRSDVQCRDAAGNVRTVAGPPTTTLYDRAIPGNVPFPPARCSDGEVAVGGGLEVSDDGGSSWTKVGESAPVPELVATLPSEFPECFVAGAQCALTLWKIQPSGDLEYCGNIGELCYGWNRTPAENVTMMYQCRYGSYVVDLRYCSSFRDPVVGVLPNTDSDGNLLPITAPSPGVGPGAQPGTTPGTPVDPDGNPLPGSTPNPDSQQCWPTGWGVFNPFSWVFMPVQCALHHAFVPSTAATTLVQTRVDIAVGTSAPGTIARTVASADWSGIESGCNGINIDMGWLKRDGFSGADFPSTLNIANACPGTPLHPFAVFSSILIGAGTVVICFRTWPALIGRIFTYGGVDG